MYQEIYDSPDKYCFEDLSRVLSSSDSRIVVDVGANIGQFARQILDVVDCELHCFEPGIKAYESLTEFSAIEPRITPHQTAVDEENGTKDFYISESDVGSSLLEPKSGQLSKWAKNIAVETVTCKRLDSIFDELGLSNIGLLKSDAQGADGRVLRSAGKYLNPRNITSVLVELNLHSFYEGQDSLASIVELMTDRGYFLAGFYPHRNRNGWLWWADGLFLPLEEPFAT